MKIKEIIYALEKFAPPSYQESYDNCGLIVGNDNENCSGVLATLDVTVQVVEEAINNGCNLIVAHHPIIFSGLKKITGKNYVERTIIKAIKHDIAIFAIHTNLDNIYNGVNQIFAQKIGLVNTQVLQPKNNILSKLIIYSPINYSDIIKEVLFKAGAGNIGNYSECSFTSTGVGTFKGNSFTNPFLGKQNIQSAEKEDKIEVLLPNYMVNHVLEMAKSAHPYEEIAYEIIPLSNYNATIGSGLIGELTQEMSEVDFLNLLKHNFCLKAIKHTAFLQKKIKKIAICGGSGSFLTKTAIARNADVFVTSDIKYHEFFDAEGKIFVADIGHYESEQFTIDLIINIITTNFPTFAVLKSKVNTNPVHYFVQ